MVRTTTQAAYQFTELGCQHLSLQIRQLQDLELEIQGNAAATAHALKSAFRDTRKRLHEAAMARMPPTATPREIAKSVGYAPLQLYYRSRGAHHELRWKLVHIRNERTVFEEIAHQKDGNFHLTKLASLARPYELELVQETELKARVIRARFQLLPQLRSLIRNLASTVSEAALSQVDHDHGGLVLASSSDFGR